MRPLTEKLVRSVNHTCSPCFFASHSKLHTAPLPRKPLTRSPRHTMLPKPVAASWPCSALSLTSLQHRAMPSLVKPFLGIQDPWSLAFLLPPFFSLFSLPSFHHFSMPGNDGRMGGRRVRRRVSESPPGDICPETFSVVTPGKVLWLLVGGGQVYC